MQHARSRAVRALVTAAAALALAPAAHAADARQQISQALAAGDGESAATLIKARGYQLEPQALGDIIYDGGALAVHNGTGTAFTKAVPVAYLEAGVPYAVANLSFAYGGRTAVVNGLTPEQGLVGGTAVANTNAAYLSSGAVLKDPLAGNIGIGPLGGR
jgi:hypothetical protein